MTPPHGVTEGQRSWGQRSWGHRGSEVTGGQRTAGGGGGPGLTGVARSEVSQGSEVTGEGSEVTAPPAQPAKLTEAFKYFLQGMGYREYRLTSHR